MAEMIIKRRPIRAAFYGLMLGFSIWYFLQFQFATFSFDSVGGVVTRAVIIIVAVMALSVIWAYVAPARKPKGSPPDAATAPEPAAVVAPAAAAEPVEATEPVAAAEPMAAETPDRPEGDAPALPDDDETPALPDDDE